MILSRDAHRRYGHIRYRLAARCSFHDARCADMLLLSCLPRSRLKEQRGVSIWNEEYLHFEPWPRIFQHKIGTYVQHVASVRVQTDQSTLLRGGWNVGLIQCNELKSHQASEAFVTARISKSSVLTIVVYNLYEARVRTFNCS